MTPCLFHSAEIDRLNLNISIMRLFSRLESVPIIEETRVLKTRGLTHLITTPIKSI